MTEQPRTNVYATYTLIELQDTADGFADAVVAETARTKNGSYRLYLLNAIHGAALELNSRRDDEDLAYAMDEDFNRDTWVRREAELAGVPSEEQRVERLVVRSLPTAEQLTRHHYRTAGSWWAAVDEMSIALHLLDVDVRVVKGLVERMHAKFVDAPIESPEPPKTTPAERPKRWPSIGTSDLTL